MDTGFNIAAALAAHGREVERLAVYKAAEVDTFLTRCVMPLPEVKWPWCWRSAVPALIPMMTAAGLGEQLRQMR